MKNNNFNEMESLVRWIFDPVVIIDDEEPKYGSKEMFKQYVDQIITFYLQEKITEDIRSAGLSELEEEALLDWIGNIDVSLYTDELYQFYRDRCQFDDFLEDLRSTKNS